MAHLFDHDAGDGAAITFRGRGFKQVALLLDAGKFSVALVDDHVHQRVAHLLRGHLAQVLPLVAAFVGTELDLFGFDRAVERVEVEGFDVFVLTPISLRHSLNSPTQSLKVPIFATLPGINCLTSGAKALAALGLARQG